MNFNPSQKVLLQWKITFTRQHLWLLYFVVLANRWKKDNDFIICLLRGLGSEFGPIMVVINARDNFPFIKAIISKLKEFDLQLQTWRHSTISFYTNKTITSPHRNAWNSSCGRYQNNYQKYKTNHGGGRYQGRIIFGCPRQHLSRGNGKPPARHGCITCFLCGGPNHKADNCWASDEEAESYQAFLAAQTRDISDDVWYPNTGANQNETPTFTDAKGIKQYSGTYSMMVGNGLGLPISIIGTFQVFIFHSALKMLLLFQHLKRDYSLFFYLLLIIIATLCFIHEVFL